MSTSSESLAQQLSEVVWRLARKMRIQDGGVSTLTLSHQAVLAHLEKSGPLTSAELARKEHVQPQSMGIIVKLLRDEGLVESAPAREGDARRRELKLTAEGVARLVQERQRRVRWLVEQLDDQLSASERSQLAQSLTQLSKLQL